MSGYTGYESQMQSQSIEILVFQGTTQTASAQVTCMPDQPEQIPLSIVPEELALTQGALWEVQRAPHQVPIPEPLQDILDNLQDHLRTLEIRVVCRAMDIMVNSLAQECRVAYRVVAWR